MVQIDTNLDMDDTNIDMDDTEERNLISNNNNNIDENSDADGDAVSQGANSNLTDCEYNFWHYI